MQTTANRQFKRRWIVGMLGIPQYAECYETPGPERDSWEYVWVPSLGLSIPIEQTFFNELDAWDSAMRYAVKEYKQAQDRFDKVREAYKSRVRTGSEW